LKNISGGFGIFLPPLSLGVRTCRCNGWNHDAPFYRSFV